MTRAEARKAAQLRWGPNADAVEVPASWAGSLVDSSAKRPTLAITIHDGGGCGWWLGHSKESWDAAFKDAELEAEHAGVLNIAVKVK